METCSHCGSSEPGESAHALMQVGPGPAASKHGMMVQGQAVQMTVCASCGTVTRLWFEGDAHP